MAGIDHVAPTVGTGFNVGEDVHLARIGIDERSPQIRIDVAGKRVALIVILVHRRGRPDDVVRVEDVLAGHLLSLPVLIVDVVYQLVNVHQLGVIIFFGVVGERPDIRSAGDQLPRIPIGYVGAISRVSLTILTVNRAFQLVDGEFDPKVVYLIRGIHDITSLVRVPA